MRKFGGLFPRTSEGSLVVTVQESIYSKEAILKTCYLFTDRCYLYLRSGDEGSIEVLLTPKAGTVDIEALAGDFCNEIIDQRLRADISRESGKIREILVAQAFSEGDLLDESVAAPEEAEDYNRDPLRIGDSSDHRTL